MTIESRIIQYLREEIEREQKEIYSKFKSHINISYRDLKEFLNSDKFLHEMRITEIPDINKAALRIINKEQEQLSDNDFDWIRRIVKLTENTKMSSNQNKMIVLMSLGHDVNRGKR